MLCHPPAQMLQKEGYVSSQTLSTVKIIMGLIAVFAALLSQFYPLPFPQNKPLILFSVTVYVML